MPPYTAADLLSVIKREYGLDEPSAHALVGAASAAIPAPRRGLRAWVHSVVSRSF